MMARFKAARFWAGSVGWLPVSGHAWNLCQVDA